MATAASTRQSKQPGLRHTGIDLIGDVSWGAHFCQFYRDEQDLIDILVPYFKAGLENNEFCMWVTSEPLRVEEAKAALAAQVEGLERYIAKGQIEILDYSQWYTAGGKFESDRVLQGWVEREACARQRGFDGLRLTGNTFWLEKSDWQDFTEYEATVDSVIGQYRMLAICTYSLAKCGAGEIMDVVSNHAFALIKRAGEWQVIESAERKRIEASLQESDARYRELFESMDEGFALCEMVYDESSRPVDFRYLKVNPAFARLTGLPVARVVGHTVKELIPGIEPFWIETYDRVVRTGRSERFDNAVAALGKHYEIHAWHSSPGSFAVLFNDITDRKRAEEVLRETAVELKRSNQDLEQFAYVSSHDLQEPLRMVTGFVQLLQKEYSGKLDTEADAYIRYAVDGAKRMQQLIDDLLAYSRVGSKARKPAPTDVEKVLNEALANLSVSINESKAEIVRGPMPAIMADGPQLVQVFQNLIGNAIKFRGQASPVISAEARCDGAFWVFSVKDNGIGIAPEFHERIFMIFERLHTKEKYPGTGIGLAVCKKIVERNRGRIWVESNPGQGSTFCFSIPA